MLKKQRNCCSSRGAADELQLTMTTDVSGGPGAFRRLLNKVARWSEALDYSGFDYTLNRIAFVERELAALKERMRQFEASRHEPPDVSPMRRPVE